MGGEIDVIQCYGSPSLALCIQLGMITKVCLAYRGFRHAKTSLQVYRTDHKVTRC